MYTRIVNAKRKLEEVIVGVPTIGNAAAKGSEVVQRKQMIEKLCKCGYNIDTAEALSEEDMEKVYYGLTTSDKNVCVDTKIVEIDSLSEIETYLSMDESELKSCGLDDKQISKMDNEIQYLINSSDDILKKECGLDNVEIKMLRQAEKNAKNSTKKEKDKIAKNTVKASGSISSAKLKYTQSCVDYSTSKEPDYDIVISYAWKTPYVICGFSDKIVVTWGGKLNVESATGKAKYYATDLFNTCWKDSVLQKKKMSVKEKIIKENGQYLGWDFYNDDNTIFDNYNYDYHGTYIATTIVQVTPKVKILPVKFLEGSTGNIVDCISAINYAIKNGADIVNCSWGFSERSIELERIILGHPEVLFICAAGNENLNLDTTAIYPASYQYKNVISVGAISNTGELYEASGYGKKVNMMAPGENIRCIFPENDITYISGTSVATAFVSAGATMIKYSNPSIEPEKIKEILIESCKKIDSLSEICQSGGCLDIAKALDNVNKLF